MQDVPPLPDVDDAPEVLSGHLWLQERVDGTPLRFQVRDAAPIRFGDDVRTFDAEDAPRDRRYSVHEVQRRLDRAALRNAVEDVESITFVGVATHRERADYDWHRLPGFLGMDVWDDDTDEWLPPDRAEQVFHSLGLTPLNALAKEVRAADFQPDRYEFPESAWRDGAVAGVVIRNKTGGRAVLENPDVGTGPRDATLVDVDPAADPETIANELVEQLVTDARFEHAAAAIRDDEARSLSFDALQEAVLDACYREDAPTFDHLSVDHDAFRHGVAERTSEFVGTHA